MGRSRQSADPGQPGGERRPCPDGLMPGLLRESRWVLVALVVILALGGTLRGFYLAQFSRTPDFALPFADADFHNYWARGLAFGNWTPPPYEVDPHIRDVPFFRPPGYAYFLAAVYKLTGHGFLGPRVVQAALGLVNAFLAFLLARRCFGNLVGLVLAAFMATFWPFIYTEGDFEEPVVSVFLMLALVSVLLRWAARPRVPIALAAGALVGALGLMRPNALILVVPIAAWAWWVHARRGVPKRAAGTIAALAAGVALLVSPATIRNYAVAHDFVPVSSNGGINLYIANRDGADGLVRATFPGIGTLDTCFDHLQIVSHVERIVGRPMKHSEVSNYFTRMALAWIRKNPGKFLKLVWHKTLLFWGPVEVGGNKLMVPERTRSPVLSKDPIGSALPLGLALPGIAYFVWERRRKTRAGAREGSEEGARFEFGVLAVWLILFWYASYMPFAILARYRMPILPLVFLFAAFFVDRLVALVRARDVKTLLPWAAALAGALVVSHTNFAKYEPSLAHWHYQNGIVMYRLALRDHPGDPGKLDGAIAEYRKALVIKPDYLAVMNDLGAALGSQGRIGEALPYFVRAAQVLPDDYLAQYNAALALEVVGRRAEARPFYEAALRAEPDAADARAGLLRVQTPAGPGDSNREPARGTP